MEVDPQLGHLLTVDWKGSRGEPFTADELLGAAPAILEAWFRRPPLGPVPHYLVTHESVYGCVAEYEDRLEEQDRWKEGRLTRWLREQVGKRCAFTGARLVLETEEPGGCVPPRFRLVRVEEPVKYGSLTDG